jgi:catechol 2,3-dioxygenase-like lactoylglutathione lyase family enzyme
VAITPVTEAHRGRTFQQGSVGLHHGCFRARSREDVESYAKVALELDATIIRAPEQGEYAPGYYSILFEDPDGIRIEINHVPGKGLLDDKSA